MAYSCYVRHEGRGLIEVQPTVTIRFDQLTAITRNRIRRVFQDNYNPYGWSAKPTAVLTAMQGHYEVFGSLFEPTLMRHPDFDREMFAAKALLIGYKFTIQDKVPPSYWTYRRGYLQYVGDRPYHDRAEPLRQVNKLAEDTLLPIARSLIDHNRLKPIMDALELQEPYSFPGVNMR